MEATRTGVPWKRWGPYLSDRQWGTVREDYSDNGDAWSYFTHDQARSRAYKWGEDGIAGLCDDHQRLCFGIALWNGVDPILKERMFGLTNAEGNHGEYAKRAPDDIEVRITVANRSSEAATVHLLPSLWFRNTWWMGGEQGTLRSAAGSPTVITVDHTVVGGIELRCAGTPQLLFTNNESNAERLWGASNTTPYVKDAFHEYVVHGRVEAVNPALIGTKAAALYVLDVPAEASQVVQLRLCPTGAPEA